MHEHKWLIRLAGLCRVGLIGLIPGTGYASTSASDIWGRLATQDHCVVLGEDHVATVNGKVAGDVGLAKIHLPPSPNHLTIQSAVKFLSAHLPGYTVWRDRVNRHVIHIVYTKALMWKSNPLNQKLTFHGTMSFMHLASKILIRRFPKLHFYYDPFTSGAILLPYAPDLKPYKKPLHFDVKGETLRQLLTTGLVYRLDPQHFGGTFWQCYYLTKHGKLTGRIEITMLASPASTLPAAQPKGAVK